MINYTNKFVLAPLAISWLTGKIERFATTFKPVEFLKLSILLRNV